MEMDAAVKEAEPRGNGQWVWVWLPDRRCYVGPKAAAAYHERHPPESLQPPCDSPPCDSPPCERRNTRHGNAFADGTTRSLSHANLQETMSSGSQEMFSPSVRMATPETPSAGAFKRKRADDGRQWAIRSERDGRQERQLEWESKRGSEMCECGLTLDDCICK